jgi:hypothetical protein
MLEKRKGTPVTWSVAEQLEADVLAPAYDGLSLEIPEVECSLHINQTKISVAGILLDRKKLLDPKIVDPVEACVDEVKARIKLDRLHLGGMKKNDKAAFDELKEVLDLVDIWSRVSSSRAQRYQLLITSSQ